jgi:hypothetical protein
MWIQTEIHTDKNSTKHLNVVRIADVCLNIEITDTHSNFLFAFVNKLCSKKLLNIKIKCLTECRARALVVITLSNLLL